MSDERNEPDICESAHLALTMTQRASKVASTQVDLNYCVSDISASLLFFWRYLASIHRDIIKSRMAIEVSTG
jgi:hypothetical protein